MERAFETFGHLAAELVDLQPLSGQDLSNHIGRGRDVIVQPAG